MKWVRLLVEPNLLYRTSSASATSLAQQGTRNTPRKDRTSATAVAMQSSTGTQSSTRLTLPSHKQYTTCKAIMHSQVGNSGRLLQAGGYKNGWICTTAPSPASYLCPSRHMHTQSLHKAIAHIRSSVLTSTSPPEWLTTYCL